MTEPRHRDAPSQRIVWGLALMLILVSSPLLAPIAPIVQLLDADERISDVWGGGWSSVAIWSDAIPVGD